MPPDALASTADDCTVTRPSRSHSHSHSHSHSDCDCDCEKAPEPHAQPAPEPEPEPARPDKRARRRRYSCSDTVHTRFLVWHLLAITFATGLLDATTYADLQIFCSNQTGNTIVFFVLILGVNLHPGPSPGAGAGVPSVLTTGVSLATFLVSGFVFGRVGNACGNRSRAWLCATMAFQTTLLLLLAVLIQLGIIRVALHPAHGKQLHDSLLALLLAATAGAQVAMARSSGINEIPTAMLTSPFIDFLVDPLLFANPRRATHDPKVNTRNTRGLYIASLLIGTIIGAAMHKHSGTTSVIYFAMALRFLGTLFLATCPASKSHPHPQPT